MTDRMQRVAEALREYLREEMAKSAAAKNLIVQLANLALEEAERLDTTEPAPAGQTHAPDQPSRPEQEKPEQDQPRPARIVGHLEAPTPARRYEPRGVVSLSMGDEVIKVAVEGARDELEAAEESSRRETEPERQDRPLSEIELSLMTKRSRLKAEACRLFIEKRAVEGDPEAERPFIQRMHEMIDTGRSLPDCFLWVFWRYETQPASDALERIARCYDALAEASALCHTVTTNTPGVATGDIQTAMEFLAEANSALRIALRETWLTQPDQDQHEAHLWLRNETYLRQIRIDRFMRLDDPADPARADELIAEIKSRAASITRKRDSASKIEAVLKRLRYHASRLPEAGEGDEHDCRKINEASEELLELGLAPTDHRLLAAAESVRPEAFPPGAPPCEAMAKAFERLRADRDRAAESPSADGRAAGPDSGRETSQKRWSERVLEARGLLRGGVLVLIGGIPNADAIRRIRDAFELADVDWVELTEHGASAPMRAPIMRPETKVVLVLIKLTGHLHAEEARRYARDAGKPCVLLPAGYNPEQIAEQVMTQAESRLALSVPDAEAEAR